MRAWLRRWRENRQAEKSRKAYDRLHGRGAVPRRGRSGGSGKSRWSIDFDFDFWD